LFVCFKQYQRDLDADLNFILSKLDDDSRALEEEVR
jgi:hypothetical protein